MRQSTSSRMPAPAVTSGRIGTNSGATGPVGSELNDIAGHIGRQVGGDRVGAVGSELVGSAQQLVLVPADDAHRPSLADEHGCDRQPDASGSRPSRVRPGRSCVGASLVIDPGSDLRVQTFLVDLADRGLRQLLDPLEPLGPFELGHAEIVEVDLDLSHGEWLPASDEVGTGALPESLVGHGYDGRADDVGVAQQQYLDLFGVDLLATTVMTSLSRPSTERKRRSP